jgi:YidC/Oxa1 family membrane protein insertase
MEQKRLIIAICLSIVVFLAWHLFFAEKEALKKPVQTKQEQPATAAQPAALEPQAQVEKETGASDKSVSPINQAQPARPAKTISIETPLYTAKISENGAAFASFVLKAYREKSAKDSPLKELLSPDLQIETAKVGFSGKSVPGLENAVFSIEPELETLNVTDSLQHLTFYWESDTGVRIEKTFSFSPDTYLIGFEVVVKNGSARTIQDHLTLSAVGKSPQDTRMYGFEGPSALINDQVVEVKIKDIAEKNTYTGNLKWLAIQDRYFINSIISKDIKEASMLLSLIPDQGILAQYVQPQTTIGPGAQLQAEYFLFLGPKSMRIIRGVGHDLGKAIDFGMFTFIAKPCLWLMNFLHDYIPNYGLAIIILTILIKIVLWPLGSKSYKSMSEMKKIQPLMKDIREKHKDDKKKMNEEVMALYKTYKINPLGGCLPMVVQIPVFFALYRMLYSAIELRHAPFFLWINDLSAPDRLFRFGFEVPFMEPPYGIPVLTLVMGGTMLLQQKMSPPMGDPTQAKMMMLMPVVFTVIFINFSSGLVLYWLVNNVLSIAQQYYIQKKYA